MNRTLRSVGSTGLLILCAFFASACAVSVPTAIRPIASPSEAVRFLHDRYQETTPYRALVTIRPLTGGIGVSLDAVLRIDAIDRFRLQGLSPLGGVLFTLESEGEQFHLRLPDRGSVSGPVEMLDSLYGRLLPLKVSQLSAVLIPYGDSHEVPEGVFFFEEETGYYRLSKLRLSPADPESADGTAGWAYPVKTWFIEKRTGNLVKMEIHDADPDGVGRKALVVEYGDFRILPAGRGGAGGNSPESGVAMPHRILVKRPDGAPLTELIFQEIHLGEAGSADPGT